jgi:hypothetical protein
MDVSAPPCPPFSARSLAGAARTCRRAARRPQRSLLGCSPTPPRWPTKLPHHLPRLLSASPRLLASPCSRVLSCRVRSAATLACTLLAHVASTPLLPGCRGCSPTSPRSRALYSPTSRPLCCSSVAAAACPRRRARMHSARPCLVTSCALGCSPVSPRWPIGRCAPCSPTTMLACPRPPVPPSSPTVGWQCIRFRQQHGLHC